MPEAARPPVFAWTARLAFLAIAFHPSTALAQAPARPQPTCIQRVSLDRARESEERHTILLRDGRIESILAADAELPPGVRVIDGEGLLCLPAFVDAYARRGIEVPEPRKDQDVPVDTGRDPRIDMRLANRKGIQPAFRAAEALAIEEADAEDWREAGFGAAHLAPGGELLAGTSCVVTTRTAAMRELVLAADAFSTAAFRASGPGYPSTLMGYHAQLRQFFLDAGRHAELVRRREAGAPGPRPPFDPELLAGARLLDGGSTLLCEAQTHRDVERWIRLGEELGFTVAFAGGRDAWRVAQTLAARDLPVLLTLDWGKEVDDPSGDEEEGEEEADTEEVADAGEPEEAEPEWEYEEPLAVRFARRAEWEERRDSALRLAEAGVRIAFGTADAKPAKLLDKVRTLVEEGLPAETALAALTTEAAAILGLGDRIGQVAPGFDANLVLWSADPFTEKKAEVRWIFVDGFPTEYEAPEDAGDDTPPDDGVDATGTWHLSVEGREGEDAMRLVITMDEDGAVAGTLFFPNRGEEEEELEAEVEGRVSGSKLRFEGTMDYGQFEMEVAAELALDGDELTGEFRYTAEFFPDGLTREASGRREPEHEERTAFTDEDHRGPHGHGASCLHGEQEEGCRER